MIKKKQVLVFRTSNDKTMQKIFAKLTDCSIDCLVQTKDFFRLKSEYPDIIFIDICRASFYDIPERVLKQVISKRYDEVYILLSGNHGYNYGNVIDVLKRCDYEKGFFYNADGMYIVIPRFNPIHNFFIKLYLKILYYIY